MFPRAHQSVHLSLLIDVHQKTGFTAHLSLLPRAWTVKVSWPLISHLTGISRDAQVPTVPVHLTLNWSLPSCWISWSRETMQGSELCLLGSQWCNRNWNHEIRKHHLFMCACMCVYLCVYVCACVCTWLCACVYVCICLYMCVWVCLCVCVYACGCIMCIYVYACVCIMCMFVCAHSHMHSSQSLYSWVSPTSFPQYDGALQHTLCSIPQWMRSCTIHEAQHKMYICGDPN